MPRKMLTFKEAAKDLGVRPDTLRQQADHFRKTGGRVGLRARKRDGLWLVEPAEVERYRQVSLGQPGRRRKAEEGRS